MFKTAIIYRIAQGWTPDIGLAEDGLAKIPFTECGATQEESGGWIPPRGEEHGALLESVGGQWILRYKTETKQVPAQVLKRRVDEKSVAIEKATGRKPGKKERKELQEEAKLDLLPMAFTRQASTWVWIDPKARTLLVDAGSQARADVVVSLLVESLPGLSLSLLYTETSPQAAMSHWLSTQEPPTGFTVDRECELKASDESKAVVRYGRHPLNIEEVQAHIAAGKLPTRVAMTWDDRVSFVLTEGLQVKKINFLDTVFEGTKKDDSGFDTDVAIATGELSKLIPDLIEAMGGESDGVKPDAGAGAKVPGYDALVDGAGAFGRAVVAEFKRMLPKGIDRVEIRHGGSTVAVERPLDGEPDPLYAQAVDLVRAGKPSISYVQRHLRIGYNRAARLLETMEKAGVVSAADRLGVRTALGAS